MRGPCTSTSSSCGSSFAAMPGCLHRPAWTRRVLQRHQPLRKAYIRGKLRVSSYFFNGAHYHTSSGVFESWDPDSEEYRTERRTTYNFDDWKKHRSWQRYFRHFKTLPRSGIFNALIRPVAWVTTFSIAIVAYVKALTAGLLPSWMPHMLSLPIEPFQLTSFALSLLLVFRTNSSYQRWFEGRRRFGAVTHFSRDLARQAFAYFKPHDVERKAMFARWLVAFFTSVYCQLREGADLRESLTPLLRPLELKQALNSSNPANFCLQMLSSLISTSGISSQIIAKMDHDLTLIVDALSSCERIVSTPIPLSYTRHTARFMMLWLFALPFSLWMSCGWLTVPIIGIVSFILLGIEEIGVQIEEPFGILAMERMCERNKEHVFSMYREHLNVLQAVQQFEHDSQFAESWWRHRTAPPPSSSSSPASPSTSETTSSSSYHHSPNHTPDTTHRPDTATHRSSSNGVSGQKESTSKHSGSNGVRSGPDIRSNDWNVLPDPHSQVHPFPPLHADCLRIPHDSVRPQEDTSTEPSTSSSRHKSERDVKLKNGTGASAKTPETSRSARSSGSSRSSSRSESRRDYALAGESARGGSKARSAVKEPAVADSNSPLRQAVLMATYMQPY